MMESTVIDLRSDTVTLPTAAMRRAMCEADVGDDLRGDDPTVQRLEAMAAERLGKEAGLLVISGTMGNLVCLLARCGPADQVIVGDLSHIFAYESAGVAALGGVQVWALPNRSDGLFDITASVEASMKPRFDVCPRTKLICLENTHNRLGGVAIPPRRVAMITDVAHQFGVSTHLDGARVFNAAAALDIEVRDLVRSIDSVMFCLSKGLSAPLGSIVCGSRSFVERARVVRNRLGGGMRQAGVFAAAGIVALEHMVDRLVEDHFNAQELARGMSEIGGLALDLARVQSNIVVFELVAEDIGTEEFVASLGEAGVRILSVGPRLLRAVTHRGIGSEDVQTAVRVIRQVMQALPISQS